MNAEERLGEATMRRGFEEYGGVDRAVWWLLRVSSWIVDDEPVDVRLRYHGGEWFTYSGDSSYDQDHRGYWGASSVSADLTPEDAAAIARDLLEQVLDHAAQCGYA